MYPGNITSNVNIFPDLLDVGMDDRTASFLPWAHSFGQTVELHFVVGAGASMGLTSAKTLMEDLPNIRPTILVAVPTVFNRVYDGLQKMMAAKGGVTKALFLFFVSVGSAWKTCANMVEGLMPRYRKRNSSTSR